MRLKTTHLEFFDKVALKDATFRNKSFPMHYHEELSIGIVASGVELLKFSEKELYSPPQSVILINPFDCHANRTLNEAVHLRYKTIYVNPDVLTFVDKKYGIKNYSDFCFSQEIIDDAFLYKMLYNFHEQMPHRQNDLLHIMEYVLRNYAARKPEALVKNAHLHDMTLEIQAYLKQFYHEKINLDTLARQYGLDKFKLIRLFKARTGITPVGFQLICRVNVAKALMSEERSLTDIALETGFYDQSHFIHCFKKYVGVTPQAYKAGLTNL